MRSDAGPPAESTPQWHTYRCPVCGHADEVDLPQGPHRSVECSHCGTDLEVSVRTPEVVQAAVKVSTRKRRRH